MTFYSASFWGGLAILVAIHWRLPPAWRPLFLLLASLLFYGFADWHFLPLISLAFAIDWALIPRIYAARSATGASSHRTAWLLLALHVALQVGILVAFKYAGFFLDCLSGLLGRGQSDSLRLILPLGISFYTFRSITYSVDVYRGRMRPALNPVDGFLYLSFFPTVQAGPIDRARDFLPQLRVFGTWTRAGVLDGLDLIAWGLFKKLYVADNLARLVDPAYCTVDLTADAAWVAYFGYAFQLYCDFSGYTDIARGVASLLGIRVSENFRYPYLAFSPSDFWTRWHISLSSWLRDYLFAPLGGALRSRARAYFNLMVTMLVAGLWHGASWMFVLWGGYWGMLMVMHRIFQPSLRRFRSRLRSILPHRPRRVLEIALVFHLTCAGWLLLRSPDLGTLRSMIERLGQGRPSLLPTVADQLAPYVIPLFLVEGLLLATRAPSLRHLARVPLWGLCAVYAVIFYLMALHGAQAQSFIYAQF